MASRKNFHKYCPTVKQWDRIVWDYEEVPKVSKEIKLDKEVEIDWKRWYISWWITISEKPYKYTYRLELNYTSEWRESTWGINSDYRDWWDILYPTTSYRAITHNLTENISLESISDKDVLSEIEAITAWLLEEYNINKENYYKEVRERWKNIVVQMLEETIHKKFFDILLNEVIEVWLISYEQKQEINERLSKWKTAEALRYVSSCLWVEYVVKKSVSTIVEQSWNTNDTESSFAIALKAALNSKKS